MAWITQGECLGWSEFLLGTKPKCLKNIHILYIRYSAQRMIDKSCIKQSWVLLGIASVMQFYRLLTKYILTEIILIFQWWRVTHYQMSRTCHTFLTYLHTTTQILSPLPVMWVILLLVVIWQDLVMNMPSGQVLPLPVQVSRTGCGHSRFIYSNHPTPDPKA